MFEVRLTNYGDQNINLAVTDGNGPLTFATARDADEVRSEYARRNPKGVYIVVDLDAVTDEEPSLPQSEPTVKAAALKTTPTEPSAPERVATKVVETIKAAPAVQKAALNAVTGDEVIKAVTGDVL